MQDTQEQKGFSIVEILISLAIGLIVLAALATTFIAQNKAYNVQEQVTGMLQAARAGMDIMGREIIMAGFDPAENMQLTDPDASKFVGIPLPASNPASVVEIYADLNGDGDTADANEHIIYAFANDQLTRDSGSGAQTFINNVEDFKVEYLKADGDPANSTEDIRQVRVTLTVGTGRADVDYHRTRTLTSTFIPRNLNNTTTTTSSASSTTMIVTSTTEEETTTTEEETTTTEEEATTTEEEITTTEEEITTTEGVTTTTVPQGGFEVTIRVYPNHKAADITAEVQSSVLIGSAKLFYQVNTGELNEVVMSYVSFDEIHSTYSYSVSISFPKPARIDYYVEAYSADGEFMGRSADEFFYAE